MKFLVFPFFLTAALVAIPTSGSAQESRPAPDSTVAAPVAHTAETAQRPKPRRRNGTVITREEILDSQLSDAHAVVLRLRPQWLRVRGHGGSNVTAYGVKVYVDTVEEGDVSVLRGMAAETIQEIRYYDPRATATRFGLGNGTTVIVVVYGGVPASN